MTTVTIPELVHDQLEALAKAVDAAREALKQYREGCTAYAPHAIGEIVTITDYSHRGKDMRVDGVHLVQLHGGHWSWKVVGPVVKKDGTVSSHQRGENIYLIERNK